MKYEMNKILIYLTIILFNSTLFGQEDENSYSVDSALRIKCKIILSSEILTTELEFDTSFWSIENEELIDKNNSKYIFTYIPFSKKDKKKIKKRTYDSHVLQKYLNFFYEQELDSNMSFQYFPKYKLMISKNERKDSLTSLLFFMKINNEFGLSLTVFKIPYKERSNIEHKILNTLFNFRISVTENLKEKYFDKKKKNSKIKKEIN